MRQVTTPIPTTLKWKRSVAVIDFQRGGRRSGRNLKMCLIVQCCEDLCSYQIRLSIKLDPLPPRRYITFCLAMSGLAQHIFRRTAHCKVTYWRYSTAVRQSQGLQTRIQERRINHRFFQNLAPEDRPKPPRNSPASTSTADTLNPLEQPQITAAQERRSNWRIIKNLMVNVWPKNDWKTRGTVILGFAFLISGKVCPITLLSVNIWLS